MERDFSKYSDIELERKLAKIDENIGFINTFYEDASKKYSKLVTKRWVSPLKILGVKKEMDQFNISSNFLEEYRQLILEEISQRKENKNKI